LRNWLSAAIVAGVLIVAGPGMLGNASAAPSAKTNARAFAATDSYSPRHHTRHHRGHSRPPAYYYARPVYYRPYPNQTPVPFFLGIGFGPAW
jgi:hypothetical protein